MSIDRSPYQVGLFIAAAGCCELGEAMPEGQGKPSRESAGNFLPRRAIQGYNNEGGATSRAGAWRV